MTKRFSMGRMRSVATLFTSLILVAVVCAADASAGTQRFSGGPPGAIACPAETTCFLGTYNPSEILAAKGGLGPWTEQTIPKAYEAFKPGTIGGVTGMSCPTSTMCMAVGNIGSSRTSEMLAERWTQGRWVKAIGASVSELPDAVSCPTATWCVAAGQLTGRQGPLEWEGKAWQNMSGAVHGDAAVDGMSCWRRGRCIDVGSYDLNSTDKGAFAEQLANGRWSTIEVPHPILPGGITARQTVANVAEMNDIHCFAWNACDALETLPSYSGYFASSARWNGHRWSTSVIGRFSQPGIESFACATASRCVAAGGQHSRPLVMHQVDGRWKQSHQHFPPSARLVYTVACPTPSRCLAAGEGQYGDDFVSSASP